MKKQAEEHQQRVEDEEKKQVEIWWSLSITYTFTGDRGRHGRDRMILGFTTTYGISAYHY